MTRKRIKPMVARAMATYAGASTNVAARVATHVPKNSSMTTALGSAPQYFSITLSDHTPMNNEASTRMKLAMNNIVGDRTKYNPIQISKAKKAPAVPGATETKPVPKPVEMIT